MASISSIIQGGFPCASFSATQRRMIVVRAEAINESKPIVHTVDVTQLSKPVTSYCRCWKSEKLPICNGSHVKHTETTGNNIGPLELKKQ